MKRDMDLVRHILFEIEASDNNPMDWIDIKIENHNTLEISYHIQLLHQAGLIEADNLTDSESHDWRARHLTWHGHEFLDTARNDTVWQKAKSIIIEKGSGLNFELLKNTLLMFIQKGIGV